MELACESTMAAGLRAAAAAHAPPAADCPPDVGRFGLCGGGGLVRVGVVHWYY
jgi:hypothetical protein